jgi:type I restriction enzyme, S subunit
MKAGWKKTLLGDVIDIHDSRRIPLSGAQRSQRQGKYPYYGAQSIIDFIDDYIFDGKFLLIAEDGENLRSRKEPIAFFASGKFWVNNHAHIVTAKPELADDYFIKACLNHANLAAYVTGAAQPKLSQGNLKLIEIDLPDLPTQRKITGILSAYDDLIENNLRRIKILEEMAQSLYREWFVHFRFPGHESAKFIDSSMGQIPKGWEVGRLEDVLVLQRGFDLPKAEREVGKIPIYAASGITGYHSESKVKGPGIVTGRSGTIGQVVYIHEDFWPLNTVLWVKAFPRSEPLYAYFVLSSIDLKGFNSGAAVPTLNRNDIHSLETLIPPIALQSRFQENAGAMLAQAQILTLSIQNLRRTRDLLLPKLLTEP